MTINNLIVESKEQIVRLSENFYADIKFDLIYKRWYYNLYNNGTMVAAGIALVPDSAGLLGFQPVSLGMIDLSNKHEPYIAYEELGGQLALVEIQE